MQAYGTGAEIDQVRGGREGDRKASAAPKRRRVGDLSQVSLGLILQGISLTAAMALLGLILTLWTYGYVESGAIPLAWVVIILATGGAITGEVMCLAVPKESQMQQLARAALVLTGLMVTGLGLDALMTNKGAVFGQILDIGNLVLIMVRMCLVTLFLTRLAGYVEEPTYETRSVFAMVGMPLAMAAMFGYLQFVPAVTEDSEFSSRAIRSGIQWWIIATTVAVAVMYVSILLGMGLALRRRGAASA